MRYALTLAGCVAAAHAATIDLAGAGYINYTTVTGYFMQDDPATDPSSFNYTLNNFGLINRTYPATDGITADLTQWQKFEAQVDALNAAAPLDTVYKVIFFGRHGQGYHNAAESFYGTPAWNCYWAELKGNGTTVWEDAALTPNGVLQAQIAHNFWQHEIDVQKIPYPQSYYTSPLTRCLQTANITFAGLDLPVYYPFVPVVKEFFREGISLHTCDHRSSKASIQQRFPGFKIEEGFNEYDELWNGITAESSSAQDKRSLTVLDEVFTSDDHTWISVTSHSGEIGSLLRVLGHRSFSLATGSVIPVLIKAQFLPAADAPATTVLPWTTSTWCHNGPPITSDGSLAQGCSCSATTTVLPSLSTASAYYPGQTAPLNEYTTTTTVYPSGSPSLTSSTASSTASGSASATPQTTSSTTSAPGWPWGPWSAPTARPTGGWPWW